MNITRTQGEPESWKRAHLAGAAGINITATSRAIVPSVRQRGRNILTAVSSSTPAPCWCIPSLNPTGRQRLQGSLGEVACRKVACRAQHPGQRARQ